MLVNCYCDVQFVYLLYLNLNVRELVCVWFGDVFNIYLIELQEYFLFVFLMLCVYFIIMDLGGIQEEGLVFGKLVLVMCEMIEWFEVIQVGIVWFVGIDQDRIVWEVLCLFDSESVYEEMLCVSNLYGDGYVSEWIVYVLMCMFGVLMKMMSFLMGVVEMLFNVFMFGLQVLWLL